jgi:hypothetical protein
MDRRGYLNNRAARVEATVQRTVLAYVFFTAALFLPAAAQEVPTRVIVFVADGAGC